MRSRHGRKVAAYCEPCDKQLFSSKRDAKTAIRAMGSGHLSAYRCPEVPHMFHVGNLSRAVIAGVVDRRQIYGGGQ